MFDVSHVPLLSRGQSLDGGGHVHGYQHVVLTTHASLVSALLWLLRQHLHCQDRADFASTPVAMHGSPCQRIYLHTSLYSSLLASFKSSLSRTKFFIWPT